MSDSMYVSLCMSVYVCQSMYVCQCMSKSMHVNLCMSERKYASLCILDSMYVSEHVFRCLRKSISICLTAWLSVQSWSQTFSPKQLPKVNDSVRSIFKEALIRIRFISIWIRNFAFLLQKRRASWCPPSTCTSSGWPSPPLQLLLVINGAG